MTERLEAFLAQFFGDKAPRKFGSGWLSGVLSIALGFLAICSVLALRFPRWFTLPELRERYPLELVRLAIDLGILGCLLLAGVSMLLRREKVLGITGLALGGLALLLGAGGAPSGPSHGTSLYLGLDWFVLGVLSTATLFVPLERAFPLRREQGPFRQGWLTDTQYFFMSHALAQVISVLVLLPAVNLGAFLSVKSVGQSVSELPIVMQFLACIIVADLTQYWVHRAFHKVPFLWNFHKIHHSVRTMDWIAGSRLHLVDIVVTRGLVLLPLIVLGFDELAVFAYLGFVSVHAVFIHANFRPRWRWIEPWLVMPRFHHWHHAKASDAIDRNFAVHLPILDHLFGTKHFPTDKWPASYGLQAVRPPAGYLNQLFWPLKSDRD